MVSITILFSYMKKKQIIASDIKIIRIGEQLKTDLLVEDTKTNQRSFQTVDPRLGMRIKMYAI